MSKPKKLTRREYEDKVLKHIEAVKKLSKQFNPDVNHVSMTIVENSEFMVAYTGEEIDTRVADLFFHFEDDETCHKFLKRAKLPCEGEDGKDEVIYFDDQE